MAKHRRYGALAAIVIAIAPTARHAHAQQAEAVAAVPSGVGVPSRFPIDDADPERSVPSAAQAMKQPLEMGYFVMTLSERAEAAERQGDLGKAVKYYRALGKAVPDRAVGFARACKLYERMGAREQALEQCRIAVGKDGAKLVDHARLVRLTLARPGELPSADVADMDAMLVHLGRETGAAAGPETAGAQILVHELRCELGLRLQDPSRLVTCTGALTGLAPAAPSTLAYRFALALMQRDLDLAERVLGQARAAGLPDAALASMQERLSAEHERTSIAARLLDGDLTWVVTPVCLVLVTGLLTVLSRRRPRLGERREPA
jgi:hypothetical protein